MYQSLQVAVASSFGGTLWVLQLRHSFWGWLCSSLAGGSQFSPGTLGLPSYGITLPLQTVLLLGLRWSQAISVFCGWYLIHKKHLCLFHSECLGALFHHDATMLFYSLWQQPASLYYLPFTCLSPETDINHIQHMDQSLKWTVYAPFLPSGPEKTLWPYPMGWPWDSECRHSSLPQILPS